jgi:hypothetical protein
MATLKLGVFGRSKPNNKMPDEASTLVKAVFTLDALRVGVFAPELRNLHRNLRDTHFLSTEGISWSAIRREINEVANFPEKSERIARYVRRLPILNVVLIIAFSMTAVAAALDLYVIRRYALGVVILPSLAFMATVSTLRWHYEESVRTYFEKTRPRAERIRKINNQLIAKLIAVLQKAKFPLDECEFALYNADYQNIIIKKKPRLYKGYYEVSPSSK